MKYFFGFLLIFLGLFHGLHVLAIEYGSVTNLNGTRFLSFSSLDRFASTGIFGKATVLILDTIVFSGGVRELMQKKQKQKKRPHERK